MARDRHGARLKPKLLLLDEPTAGMSPEETYRTGELIKSLNSGGHDGGGRRARMAFIRQIAQRVTVLHLGKVFAHGSMERDHRVTRAWPKYISERHMMPDIHP